MSNTERKMAAILANYAKMLTDERFLWSIVRTLFFTAGSDIPRDRREQALGVAREIIERHPLREVAGATAPDARVVAVRVLAPVVEPAMQLLKAVRNAWRPALWRLQANPPRTWAL